LAQKAAIDRERLARAIRLETLTALETYNSRAAEVQAFTLERVTRAHETLRSLGEEVEAGRLSVRDALVAQQALVELLQADIAARRAWCLSSVELARAAGVSLEGETP
jgi:cobalt-zinc-cadmium efflux system outer membrane protein